MSNTVSSTRTFMPKPAPIEGEPKAPKKPKKIKEPRQSNPVKAFFIMFGILILLLLVSFFFLKYQNAQHKLNVSGQTYNEQQTDRLGKLMVLSATETPTIITVKDASKLKNQEFYAQAENGDMTFVYQKQHRAILYRPSQNIIVNVAQVTVND